MVDLGFLSFRKEEAILEGVKKHLDTVSQSVHAFTLAVNAAAIGDRESTSSHIEEVFKKETEADTIHRELSLKIAEGAFFGGVREDILNLLETIDTIADSAKDAVRFLSSDSALSDEGRVIFQSVNMKHFIVDLEASVGALRILIAAFDFGRKEVLPKVHSVEELEEKADSDKDALLKELFAMANSMSPVAVIQLRDFIFIADDIADGAEDASDVILVLIAKGYG